MGVLFNSMVLNALVATTLAVVVWAISFIPTLQRRPGLRHGLWIIVLLKLVTPPVVELQILPGWLAAQPAIRPHPKAIPLDNVSAERSASASRLRTWSRPPAGNIKDSTWPWIAALVSGIGTVTVAVLATGQIWRLRRALRRGAVPDERLRTIGVRAAERMGLSVVPTVCVVSANISPLLWVDRSGPLIVIPRRLATEFTDEELACVMSHEIAHYLRRDHCTNLLSLTVAAICWWNPIAWWARRELRVAQESCCDALVISRAVASRRAYAETLWHALEFIQSAGAQLPALASGFGGKSSTERRFEMIANSRVSHRLSWRNYAMLIVALTVLPCLLTFSEAQEAAPVKLSDVAGAANARVVPAGSAKPRETDRRIYRVQNSDRGLVVLAFNKESKRLAWSSEIELPHRDQAVPGQRFLLHAGGGVVTIALVESGQSLTVQELNAETGKVAGECQLIESLQHKAAAAELLKLEEILLDANRVNAAQQQQKQIEQTLVELDEQALVLEQNKNQHAERLRSPSVPMTIEEREAFLDFFKQSEKLLEQDRSERELLKAVRELERALERVQEEKVNNRGQVDGTRDLSAQAPKQASSQESSQPARMPQDQWEQKHVHDVWYLHYHSKFKDCKSCHGAPQGGSGRSARVSRFHDQLKINDCRSCHKSD